MRKPLAKNVDASYEDDDKTIFSTGLTGEEKDAIKAGEERGKRGYEKEHPKCGLSKITVSKKYQDNYVRAFGHE